MASAVPSDDGSHDAVYKLLLAKLMETFPAAAASPLAAASSAQLLGASLAAHAPPPMIATSPPGSGAGSTVQLSTPSPTKDGARIGTKRSSPYSDGTPLAAAPPQPPPIYHQLQNTPLAPTTAASRPLALLQQLTPPPLAVGAPLVSQATPSPTSSTSGDLPNFLLVKVTDIRSVGRLQNILAAHGFTETRLVCANGDAAPVPAPPPTSVSGDLPIDNDHSMQAEESQRNHHQQTPSTSQYVPDFAVEETIEENEEIEEEVEVVDECGDARCSDTSATVLPPTSSGGAPSHTHAQYAQPASPVNNSAPSIVLRDDPELQVAEVRHRSVSRSDGVDNDEVYVKCRLCENRIMNTRLSNLTNHVRRHAKLKQFQCAHCSYEHNEIFKVRTHMNRAHGDTHSAPLDRRSPEMERQWEALMHACFPRNSLLPASNGIGHRDHSESISRHSQHSPGSAAAKAANHAARGHYSPSGGHISPPGMYSCSVCKELIAEENLSMHAKEEHGSLLGVMTFYICRECGFKAPQKDRVRLHAVNTHDVADVVKIPVDQRPSLMLQKLFPEKRVVTNDECEASTLDETFEDDEEDNEKNGHNGTMFNCKMCSRTLYSPQGAVMHAKRHYPTRQFHCTLCLYSAVDEAKVRAHLLTKHMSIDHPINVVDAPMQRGWMETLESCFPEVAASSGRSILGVAGDEVGDDFESDTKRRRMERAMAGSRKRSEQNIPPAPQTSSVILAPSAPIAPLSVSNLTISQSTLCRRQKNHEDDDEEEIDVV